MRYWLVKSEPETYGWEHLLAEGDANWDGVRNYQARNFLREMSVGDTALFYHSGKNPQIVGTARISRGPFQDPSDDSGKWTAVGIEALEAFAHPVPLAAVKAEPALADMVLLKNSRLSVQPVTEPEFNHLLKMSMEPYDGQ